MLFLKPVYSTMGSISEQLKYFYSQFNDILYHLSDSDYFVTNPSTGEFGHPFYVNKLKEIQKEADIFFLENDSVKNSWISASLSRSRKNTIKKAMTASFIRFDIFIKKHLTHIVDEVFRC